MYIKLHPIIPKLLLFLFLFTFIQRSYSQDIAATIKITNQKKEPLAFASITLINRLDSTEIVKKTADSSGVAKFNLKKNTQYTIRITSIN